MIFLIRKFALRRNDSLKLSVIPAGHKMNIQITLFEFGRFAVA